MIEMVERREMREHSIWNSRLRAQICTVAELNPTRLSSRDTRGGKGDQLWRRWRSERRADPQRTSGEARGTTRLIEEREWRRTAKNEVY